MSKNRFKTLLAAMGLTAALLPIVSTTALNRAEAIESNNLRRYCSSFRAIQPTGFTSDEQSRTALVIGNQDYKKGRLDNPVRNAKDMTNALTGLGFEVIEVLDGNARKMDNALNCFHEKLKESGGAGVFYYAGHAVQVEGENYLIPVNADLQVEADVRYNTVALGKVLGKMEGSNNNINIIILDSCNDDPFSDSWNRGINTRGLAHAPTVSGSLIAYANQPGRTVNDDGLFTARILEHINQQNLGVIDMFNQIGRKISQATQKEQEPAILLSSLPNFSFNPSPEISLEPLPTEKPEPIAAVNSGGNTFQCDFQNPSGSPITFVITATGRIALIQWETARFNHTPLERCYIVSERFQKFYNQGILEFMTVGTNNSYPVICVARAIGEDCSNNDEAVLITLEKGTDPHKFLEHLFEAGEYASGAVRL